MPEHGHEDFDNVDRRLRESRPRPSEAALTRARLAADSAAPRAPRRGSQFGIGRTRVAITALFATGVLMSGGGAALAISGINSSGSAGAAQYGHTTTGGNTVLGSEPSTPSTNTETETTPTEPAGTDTTAAQTNVGEVVQPGRQVGAGSGEKQLPFTGLAALPIIMFGVGLLGAGVFLRVRSRKVTS